MRSIRRLRRSRWPAALVLLGVSAVAHGAGLQSLLMPGEVAAPHAEIEHQCEKCHKVGDRSAQPALCGECHEAVRDDITAGTGFHGRLAEADCHACHFEHEGRQAELAPLDRDTFDHRRTDFDLHGKHRQVPCANCHDAAHPFRETTHECVDCHVEDDVHNNALGELCADCHDEKGWQGATLDHLAVTGFALKWRHADVACTDCHLDHVYKETPTTCYGCHAKDDDDKGHHGQFGQDCQQCHQETHWDDPHFVHARDTGFALRDAHAVAKCTDCHLKPLFVTTTPTQCVGCHSEDDRHHGTLGQDCAQCHAPARWEKTYFDHDRDSRFPLRGHHGDVKCAQCHQDMTFHHLPKTQCVACHEADDAKRGHQGAFGRQCQTCHVPRDWRRVIFDHQKTDFPLLGEHTGVACAGCHDNPAFGETPRQCVACHAQDDAHGERLGVRCGECHGPGGWREVDFDHEATTGFPLLGQHGEIACTDCHREPARGRMALPSTCIECHRDEDVHFGTLGARCDACHRPKDWRDLLPNAREWAKSGGPPAVDGGAP